jgi:hypothetical protein
LLLLTVALVSDREKGKIKGDKEGSREHGEKWIGRVSE